MIKFEILVNTLLETFRKKYRNKQKISKLLLNSIKIHSRQKWNGLALNLPYPEKATKIWKNLPIYFLDIMNRSQKFATIIHFSFGISSKHKKSGRFYQIFDVFSEYLNFNKFKKSRESLSNFCGPLKIYVVRNIISFIRIFIRSKKKIIQNMIL